MAKHWTQQTDARKRIGDAQRARWAKWRKTRKKVGGKWVLKNPESVMAAANGHAAVPDELPTLNVRLRSGGGAPSGKFLAKNTVRALAVEGAKVRLQAIEREREVLTMFIKGQQAPAGIGRIEDDK